MTSAWENSEYIYIYICLVRAPIRVFTRHLLKFHMLSLFISLSYIHFTSVIGTHTFTFTCLMHCCILSGRQSMTEVNEGWLRMAIGIDKPTNRNVCSSGILKHNPDGLIQRYKAKGFTQAYGLIILKSSLH